MICYHIENILKKVQFSEELCPFAAVVSTEEWKKKAAEFGFESELPIPNEHATCALVNTDSLTGSFSVPDRKDLEKDDETFSFVLNAKGIVFIDDSGCVEIYLNEISRTRKWTLPSLERFLYDFLDILTHDDLRLMETFENKLDVMENMIIKGEEDIDTAELYQVRRQLRYLLIHYDQLIDLTQEFEENENEFFEMDNLRYFHLFESRIVRLHTSASYLREYTIQLRDLLQQQNEIKQNHIMTLLTVITSIFMPLTLIAGWYGMNFKYMPELNQPISYPIVIIVCIVIVIVSLIYFKHKKWL